MIEEDLHARRISRRSVMLGGVSAAALAVAFPFRSAAEESITVEQFRNLSLRLTGAGLSDLDPTAAGKLLDGFNPTPGRRRGRGSHHEHIRVGADPKDSVVDRDLRSHDHRNLFILGSAVFPMSATANPTLTIAALSLRAVDQVKATLTQ